MITSFIINESLELPAILDPPFWKLLNVFHFTETRINRGNCNKKNDPRINGCLGSKKNLLVVSSLEECILLKVELFRLLFCHLSQTDQYQY